eukprot:jgi/Mesvir1/2226/Mv04561-RA.1
MVRRYFLRGQERGQNKNICGSSIPLGPCPEHAVPAQRHHTHPDQPVAGIQARVEGLKRFIFTEDEIDRLNTFLPNIRYVIEEAPLYKRFIIEDDPALLRTLQLFVASLYIYDLTENIMRDLENRVRRAVSANFVDTGMGEMGKIVNALRGFLCVETTHLPLRIGEDKPRKLNKNVYMKRIEPSIMADLRLEPIASLWVEGRGTIIPDMSVMGKTAKVRFFQLDPSNLPSVNVLLGGDPSDDCIPSGILLQLAKRRIDCSYLSIPHRLRLHELDVDFPPANVNYELMERMQKADPRVFRVRNRDVGGAALAAIATRIRGADMDENPLGNVTTAEGAESNAVEADPQLTVSTSTRRRYVDNRGPARAIRERNADARTAYEEVLAEWTSLSEAERGGRDRPGVPAYAAEVVDWLPNEGYSSMRLLSQYSKDGDSVPFHTFQNKIRKWIGDDIIRFNRRRMRILSYIEAWARRQGAYGLILDLENSADDGKTFSDLLMADYQLTGDVSCPSGTGTIWYEYDPAKADVYGGGKPPKIVPRIIKTWDGKEVVNPKATFPLCAQTMESFKGYAGPPPPMSDPYPAYRAPPRPVSAPSPAYAYAPSPYMYGYPPVSKPRRRAAYPRAYAGVYGPLAPPRQRAPPQLTAPSLRPCCEPPRRRAGAGAGGQRRRPGRRAWGRGWPPVPGRGGGRTTPSSSIRRTRPGIIFGYECIKRDEDGAVSDGEHDPDADSPTARRAAACGGTRGQGVHSLRDGQTAHVHPGHPVRHRGDRTVRAYPEDGDNEDAMVRKLREFVAVVYVYDLLCALMRELERRVKYATDYSLRDTSQNEMFKLLNALRGFIAYEYSQADPRPYMEAIPSSVMKDIGARGLQSIDTVRAPPDADNSHTIPANSAAYVTKPVKIRVFPNIPGSLPRIPQLLTGELAAEGDPSLLIRLLASSQIDISLFSIQHRDRLAEVINKPAAHAQPMDYGLIDRILKVDGGYFKDDDRAGVLERARAFLWGGVERIGAFPSQSLIPPYDAVIRTGPAS